MKKSSVGKNIRRLMISQLIIGIVVALLFFILGSVFQALSSLYGTLVTMVVSAYLGLGVKKAEKVAQSDPKKSLGILYFGAAQRFIMVAGLFIVGLAVFRLEPFAVAAGFGFSQIGYVINLRQQSKII